MARNGAFAKFAFEASRVVSIVSLGQIRLARFEGLVTDYAVSQSFDFVLPAHIFVYATPGTILGAIFSKVTLVAGLPAPCTSKTGLVEVCSFVDDFAALDMLPTVTAFVKKPVKVVLAAIWNTILGEKFTRKALTTTTTCKTGWMPVPSKGYGFVSSHQISAFSTAHLKEIQDENAR